MDSCIPITVIVPVYNCESYVAECLDSLKSQTMRDFEVLVVDDGSTDGSLDAARACIGDDGRFVLLPQKENRGLSAARNCGMDHARGDYLVFLDGDDRLAPDALQKLFERARSQQLDDLYFSGKSFFDDAAAMDTYFEDYSARPSFEGVATGAELYAFFVERGQFFTSAAMRMVRRAFVEQAGVRFKEGILHEDILFTFLTAASSQRSSFLNEPLYERRIRSGSIMGSRWTWRNVHGHFVSVQEMRQWLYAHGSDVDERFALAAGSKIAEWLHLCAEKWRTDVDDVEKAAYMAVLSDADRIDFIVGVLGVGAESDRIRQEFAESRAYRLGRSIVAVPQRFRDGVGVLRLRLRKGSG